MPQIGHFPGPAAFCDGCIGQAYVAGAGGWAVALERAADEVGAGRAVCAEAGSFIGAAWVARPVPGMPPPAVSPESLSQYLVAVLIRASAAIKNTPEVATTSPGWGPSKTSYMPSAWVPTRTSCGLKRPCPRSKNTSRRGPVYTMAEPGTWTREPASEVISTLAYIPGRSSRSLLASSIRARPVRAPVSR